LLTDLPSRRNGLLFDSLLEIGLLKGHVLGQGMLWIT
jgi:hypothetical protein